MSDKPQTGQQSQPRSSSQQQTQEPWGDDANYYPHPPTIHAPLPSTTKPEEFNPSIMLPPQQNGAPIPLPPSHPDFATQQLPPQSQPTHPQDPSTRAPHQPSSSHATYHTMPINDPNKTTVAFDMYIPTQQNPQYQQNHPAGCDCCPHHHKRKDGSKILYRHLKQPTWGQYIKDRARLTWEFIKQTYWHLEPWVVRPLMAGIAYNIGIQLARVCIQTFFPTYFPTTVYLPLRANARFYDLHAKRVHTPGEDLPLEMPALSSPSVIEAAQQGI